MGFGTAFVIVNPAAANGTAGKRFERLKAHPCVGDMAQTTGPGNATDLVWRAHERGFRTILACGGDGTVNEIINALMDIPRIKRPALGILPAGAANDFARAIRHRNWKRVLDSAAEGKTRPVDIGVAEGGFGRRYFAVAAFVGAPALMARRANESGKRWRGLAGYLPYFRKADLINVPIIVEFDSDIWAAEATTVVVSNTLNGAGGIRICPDARVDDGRLDLLFIRHRHHGGLTVTLLLDVLLLVCFLGPVFTGWVPYVDVRRATAKRVVLKADHTDLALDGEIVGQLPATIEVVPFALDVVAI